MSLSGVPFIWGVLLFLNFLFEFYFPKRLTCWRRTVNTSRACLIYWPSKQPRCFLLIKGGCVRASARRAQGLSDCPEPGKAQPAVPSPALASQSWRTGGLITVQKHLGNGVSRAAPRRRGGGELLGGTWPGGAPGQVRHKLSLSPSSSRTRRGWVQRPPFRSPALNQGAGRGPAPREPLCSLPSTLGRTCMSRAPAPARPPGPMTAGAVPVALWTVGTRSQEHEVSDVGDRLCCTAGR